jgi:hypothetical protein
MVILSNHERRKTGRGKQRPYALHRARPPLSFVDGLADSNL